MTHFLLATDSVHTTAAAADYLAGRLGPEDRVTALAVAESGAPGAADDPGATTRGVLSAAPVPVVVLPLARLG